MNEHPESKASRRRERQNAREWLIAIGAIAVPVITLAELIVSFLHR
jgi:hypothetical protein